MKQIDEKDITSMCNRAREDTERIYFAAAKSELAFYESQPRGMHLRG